MQNENCFYLMLGSDTANVTKNVIFKPPEVAFAITV